MLAIETKTLSKYPQKEFLVGLVLSIAILFSGIGPGYSNYPYPAFLIVFILALCLLQQKSVFLLLRRKLFFKSLSIFIIVCAIGSVFSLFFLQISPYYVIDRLIMYFVFFLYILFFSACSFSELLKGAVWACCFCFPFYLMELLWLNIHVESLIQMRKLIGLRSVYLLPSFPLLGHHEPSHVSSSFPLFFTTFFIVRQARNYKLNLFRFKKWVWLFVSSIGILSLFTMSGLWVSIIIFASITLSLATLVKIYTNSCRLRSVFAGWKIKKLFLFLLFLSVLVLLISASYLLSKYQLLNAFQDTSTVTRSYYIMRILSDAVHLSGLGVGIGGFEKEFAYLHDNFKLFYGDLIDPAIFDTYLNVGSLIKAFDNNDRIPLYSILGNIITEVGFLGALIIVYPIAITFKKVFCLYSLSSKDWLFLGWILFGLSLSIALYIGGGLRASPIPIYFICLADAYLHEGPIELHR